MYSGVHSSCLPNILKNRNRKITKRYLFLFIKGLVDNSTNEVLEELLEKDCFGRAVFFKMPGKNTVLTRIERFIEFLDYLETENLQELVNIANTCEISNHQKLEIIKEIRYG